MWRDFPARLAEATDCGALVYSRLGYGRSDPYELPRSPRFMHDEGLTFLPQLLAAAEIRDHVVIGHSDGGSIALIYAGGTCPSLLRGVVTEAAHVFCESLTLQAIRQTMTAYEHGELRERLTKYHGANTDCAFRGWADAWLDPATVAWNIEEYLPQIQVPLLAIQGREDEYGTIAQLESIRRRAGAETLLLAGCRHAPHRDQPERTLAAMSRFIAQVLACAEA